MKTPRSLAKEELPSVFVKKPKPKIARDKKADIENIILKTRALLKNGHLEKLMALEILDWEIFNNII
ncbi:hypothetical protein L6250_02285 [Candidatus Parcubacteria bacterium]|nr:hypothetical protein [Candidatus Parcubacteria bacterium]